MLQPKLFPHVLTGQRRPTLFEARFREVAVFEVYQALFDERAGDIVHRLSRSLGQLGQPTLQIRI
jgi:hypothetical protein